MDPQRRNIVANIIFKEEADLIVQNIAFNNALELAEPKFLHYPLCSVSLLYYVQPKKNLQ
jgi:hypothetical protein